MSAARILVALATYNEIESLPALVDEILRVLPEADVLVVDDNSPDGTGRWCDERAAGESRVRCIHRPAKQGLGSATMEAARYALRHNYDLLVTLDADGSHDPSNLPALVDAARHADVVIGSRYCPGGATDGWPLYRRALSRALNGLNHIVLRLPVRDSSGSYRAYRVTKLHELPLDKIRAAGYAYLEEILWHLHRIGATFVEVPIIFRQRRSGQSKMSIREVAGKLSTLWGLSSRAKALCQALPMSNDLQRAAAHDLAVSHLQRGDALGWFDALYRRAARDHTDIPWADLKPNPHLVEWLNRAKLAPGRALVVGCGLGDDAEFLASLGWDVVGFDISTEAVQWAWERFPKSKVDYTVVDLFAAPARWQQHFDLVVEIYTLQAFPPSLRMQAVRGIADWVAAGGLLFLVARARDEADPQGQLPWPLTEREIRAIQSLGLYCRSFEDFMDQEEPPVRRFRAVFQRSDATGVPEGVPA